MADFDLAIIGGGAAGLSAAAELCKHGLKILLLEARSRLCGRMHSVVDPLTDSVVELGAEFIHGEPPEIYSIIKTAGIRYCPTGEGFLDAKQGKLSESNRWEEQSQIFALMRQVAANEDLSFAEFAEMIGAEHPELADALEHSTSFVEGYNGADARKIGIKFLSLNDEAEDSINGDNSARLPDGYKSILDYWLRQLNGGDCSIKLNTELKELIWQKGAVKLISSTGEEFNCKRVLISLPLGVLKREPAAGGILFSPDLGKDKREALQNILVASVRRISLSFKERFWEEQAGDFGFIFCKEAKLPTWWTQNPIKSATLVGWAGGPYADKLPAEPDAVKDAAIESLSIIFGKPKVFFADRLLSWHYHDWMNDPHSLGAYSYEQAGSNQSARTLASPVDDTIFFAGEATETDGFSGTVHGAIRTGLRAAREILSSLR